MAYPIDMKILFITDNFPPEVNAPATRTYEHCREWVKSGIEVTIITCVPNFPEGKVYKGYKNKLYQSEMMDGIKIIRVWSYIVANKGFYKRILDYLSFAFSSFFAGLFVKTDIIIATSPQFFTTWTAFFLSKFKRKPWVFELRDLWPEGVKVVNKIDKNRLFDFLEKIELYLYRDADLIIPVTNAFKKNLMDRGIQASKIKVVTNGSNLDKFKPIKKDNKLISNLKLNNKFIIGYIGTHGKCHGLDFIINAISNIKEDHNFHFIFLGNGAEKNRIVNIAKDNGLKNVTFLNTVAKCEINRYISITDVALVPLKKLEILKTVIPSKIFENAAMKKPILLGVEGESQEIIKKYNAGLCFEPENEYDFISKLKYLKDDNELYSSCQSGCSKLASEFDRKVLANKMIRHVNEVLEFVE